MMTVAQYVLDVLKDVRAELDVPEVAELTSLALDRKVDKAILLMEEVTLYGQAKDS